MTEPFIGEIIIFSFDLVPKDWALCDGGTIPIAQNHRLYSLLSTQFGGDGQTDFGLPDMRGRVPVHPGISEDGLTIVQGQSGGEEEVTLSLDQMPPHSHTIAAYQADAASQTPVSHYLSEPAERNIYGPATNMVPMNANSVSVEGGGQPHNNLQQSLVLSFCIALDGIFPERSQ